MFQGGGRGGVTAEWLSPATDAMALAATMQQVLAYHALLGDISSSFSQAVILLTDICTRQNLKMAAPNLRRATRPSNFLFPNRADSGPAVAVHLTFDRPSNKGRDC